MTNRPHRIFIGFDHRQWASFTALTASIMERTSEPVSITPLMLNTLPIDNAGLTPFTFSRFLVPWLCDYAGWALFMDTDMIVRCDVAGIFSAAAALEQKPAVIVADLPQEYTFEQASLIVFNCGHPDSAKLTPDYVKAKTTTLIDWTDEIGKFDASYNHLVGYAEPSRNARIVHYTQGVPAYPETAASEYGEEWRRAINVACSTLPWQDLMARSVHTKRLDDGRVVPKLYREPAAA